MIQAHMDPACTCADAPCGCHEHLLTAVKAQTNLRNNLATLKTKIIQSHSLISLTKETLAENKRLKTDLHARQRELGVSKEMVKLLEEKLAINAEQSQEIQRLQAELKDTRLHLAAKQSQVSQLKATLDKEADEGQMQILRNENARLDAALSAAQQRVQQQPQQQPVTGPTSADHSACEDKITSLRNQLSTEKVNSTELKRRTKAQLQKAAATIKDLLAKQNRLEADHTELMSKYKRLKRQHKRKKPSSEAGTRAEVKAKVKKKAKKRAKHARRASSDGTPQSAPRDTPQSTPLMTSLHHRLTASPTKTAANLLRPALPAPQRGLSAEPLRTVPEAAHTESPSLESLLEQDGTVSPMSQRPSSAHGTPDIPALAGASSEFAPSPLSTPETSQLIASLSSLPPALGPYHPRLPPALSWTATRKRKQPPAAAAADVHPRAKRTQAAPPLLNTAALPSLTVPDTVSDDPDRCLRPSTPFDRVRPRAAPVFLRRCLPAAKRDVVPRMRCESQSRATTGPPSAAVDAALKAYDEFLQTVITQSASKADITAASRHILLAGSHKPLLSRRQLVESFHRGIQTIANAASTLDIQAAIDCLARFCEACSQAIALDMSTHSRDVPTPSTNKPISPALLCEFVRSVARQISSAHPHMSRSPAEPKKALDAEIVAVAAAVMVCRHFQEKAIAMGLLHVLMTRANVDPALLGSGAASWPDLLVPSTSPSIGTRSAYVRAMQLYLQYVCDRLGPQTAGRRAPLAQYFVSTLLNTHGSADTQAALADVAELLFSLFERSLLTRVSVSPLNHPLTTHWKFTEEQFQISKALELLCLRNGWAWTHASVISRALDLARDQTHMSVLPFLLRLTGRLSRLGLGLDPMAAGPAATHTAHALMRYLHFRGPEHDMTSPMGSLVHEQYGSLPTPLPPMSPHSPLKSARSSSPPGSRSPVKAAPSTDDADSSTGWRPSMHVLVSAEVVQTAAAIALLDMSGGHQSNLLGLLHWYASLPPARLCALPPSLRRQLDALRR